MPEAICCLCHRYLSRGAISTHSYALAPCGGQGSGRVGGHHNRRRRKSEGYGFLFSNPSPDELLKCAERAIAAWGEEERWRNIILRGMSADFSWDHSAKAYAELYHQLLGSQ